MTPVSCPREQDVLDAVAAQRWPDRSDEALRVHVRQCAVCGDLAEVATVLRDDRDRAFEGVRVPPSGLGWWRAEMRARHEAARSVTRPIAWLHLAAIAGAVALFVVLTVGLLGPLQGMVSETVAASRIDVAGLGVWAARLAPYWTWVAAGVAMSLVTMPLALYFALRD